MASPVELVVVGTSHVTADVAEREPLAVPEREIPGLLSHLRGEGVEASVLSTCNRTELYLAAPAPYALVPRAHDALASWSGLGPVELQGLLAEVSGPEAAGHLFRVAAGLDSLVPGEAQILGQVRRAHAVARDEGMVGPVLDRLFRQALRAGRRARSETAIGESPSSIPAVAGVLAERVAGDLRSARVLLIGAGETAELVGLNLASRGAERIVVANRTLAPAEALAARVRGRAIPFSQLGAELEYADVVVSATSSPGRVLGVADVERAARARRGRPILVLDLAVPRDVDPGVARLAGCFLYDIDDLGVIVQETLAERRREAARAEEIVEEETRRFLEWWCALEVVPVISSLRALAEEIRISELTRVSGRLQGLTPGERRAVEFLTSQIVNKLLHVPTVRLKQAAAHGSVHEDSLRHLFGLDERQP